MKRRGRGFAGDEADVNAGDEADVSGDVPRAKTRAASRDASPSDVPDWPEDGARVSDLARLGDDITPEKHAMTMTRANDDDDGPAPYSNTSPEVLEVRERPERSAIHTKCPSAYDVAVVAADRARLEALLEDASFESAASARAAALLAGLENETRALDASAFSLRETVYEKKRIAETFALQRLQASKAAVALAARFASRDDEKRDAMRRWRRLTENKKHAVAAAKRARRRHLVRNARRAINRWAAHAARTAGGARLVATRFAASRRRARLISAARAWRGVVEETGRRRARRARAADAAARKARVRVTRVARDALARWRLWTRARGSGSRGIGAAYRGAGAGVFFREDGVAGDSDRPELKKNARVDARVENVMMAAARFLFGGDAAAVFARSRVARATRRVLETSRVSSFTERKIGGVSKASCALGGFVLGGRLAHSAAEASARSKRRLAEAEIARLRRRVEELLDARVEDDRALGESFTDPDASVEASDSGASALFAMRESLAACSRAREADADTLAVSESDRVSATRAMRGAIEDKRRAESDRANAIEAMERSGAEAREARDALSDALERRLATTRLSFPPGDTNTRYEYELRGVAPDFVASASLVALIAITSLAIACVAFFARASRRLRRRVSAEARASRRDAAAAAAAAAASREAARKLRLELAASEASRVSAVEEVKRQARGDVENASAMMARLTSLAEKAEISARAHRDENEALASQNAEMKTFVTSLEMKVRRAELAVATHEAARERSRRRKRERGDARGDARVAQSHDDASARGGPRSRDGKETEPPSKAPSKLPAHRLAPFEPEAATTAAEQTPTPTSAPTSPLRENARSVTQRSVVQRVMGWNTRIERAAV